MKFMVFGLVLVAAVILAALYVLRRADHRADQSQMDHLLTFQPKNPPLYDAAMVADLPDPAQRYFNFAITPGTPLFTAAVIDMKGQFGMGDKDNPGYRDMVAKQILAAPHGFVWKMATSAGQPTLSGSDSQSWTRFWLAHLIPVARFGGTDDHRRSAFGRYVAEAVFWTPAAVLPGPHVRWSQAGPDTARMTMTHDGMAQSVDVTVDDRGQPTLVVLDRWTNANPDKTWQLQPFGGRLSAFEEFGGFHLPTHVEAGNNFGSMAYFPFFVADITSITFPYP